MTLDQFLQMLSPASVVIGGGLIVALLALHQVHLRRQRIRERRSDHAGYGLPPPPASALWLKCRCGKSLRIPTYQASVRVTRVEEVAQRFGWKLGDRGGDICPSCLVSYDLGERVKQ